MFFISSERLLQIGLRKYATFGITFIIQGNDVAKVEFGTGFSTSEAGIGETFTDMVKRIDQFCWTMEFVNLDMGQ